MRRTPAAQGVDYDPAWAGLFDEVRDFVWPAVRGLAVTIEHVGSTAVPGLAAKPIIDVDVVVAESRHVSAAIDALATVGYLHRGDLRIPGREAFGAPPGLPENHLYLVVDGSAAYSDHIDLRDYLRHHPEAVSRYADEKRRLAHLLHTDREAYVSGKAWLVEELLSAARE